ncbi:hypothetical protein [Actinomadura rupiterrae]|uniref:hypothetical protein n=1 Tax=Actinomadura rupiterrae TaxID=559627 RepID=UPI0020A5DA16|nr:hypothetical protein [Actinomadura rupiterrae]MCP2336397.1 hypothetical protein [Actinomadura rupiterrae]
MAEEISANSVVNRRYRRLVRIAYLVLPDGLDRHDRVVLAHWIVGRARPRRDHRGDAEAIYAALRGRVLAAALGSAARVDRRGRRAGRIRSGAWLRTQPLAAEADPATLTALARLSPHARAAYALLRLEDLPVDAARAELVALGVPGPDALLAEAGAVPPLGEAASRALDPTVVRLHARRAFRPLASVRELRTGRAALGLAAAAVATATAFALFGGGISIEGVRLADGPAAEPKAGRVTAAPADLWRRTGRFDLAAWPARGNLVHDSGFVAQAVHAWENSKRAPSALSSGPQLLFAGTVGKHRVTLLRAGDAVARYLDGRLEVFPVASTRSADPAHPFDRQRPLDPPQPTGQDQPTGHEQPSGPEHPIGQDQSGGGQPQPDGPPQSVGQQQSQAQTHVLGPTRPDGPSQPGGQEQPTGGAQSPGRGPAAGQSQQPGQGRLLGASQPDGSAVQASPLKILPGRYLLPPWVSGVRATDLASGGAAWTPVPVHDGLTGPVPQPGHGGCWRGPVLELSQPQVPNGRPYTVADLGELVSANLLYEPPPPAPVLPHQVGGGPDALPAGFALWHRLGCGDAGPDALDRHGRGDVESATAWDFWTGPLPDGAGPGHWVCARYAYTGGRSATYVALLDGRDSRVSGHRLDAADCSPAQRDLAGATWWRSPKGRWYYLAAASRRVTVLAADGPFEHTTARDDFLAGRGPVAASPPSGRIVVNARGTDQAPVPVYRRDAG